MELLIFFGAIFGLAVGVTVWSMKRQAAALVPAEEVVLGEEAVPGGLLRWGESQDVVEEKRYQGSQYRTVLELVTLGFVEVQATEVGRALRINTLPEPHRALARSMDGPDVFIGDDRVRISWKEGRHQVLYDRDRVVLLFTVLRYTGTELINQIGVLATGSHRLYMLHRALTHLHSVSGMEVLAERVKSHDPVELRQIAALLLGRAEEALEVALQETADIDLSLRAVDQFTAALPAQADLVLQRLLVRAEELGVVARVRALPRERALALLLPVAGNPRVEGALALLVELDPQAALPHLRAMIEEKPYPFRRLRAARLLHQLDSDRAEAVLIDLLDEPDWSGLVQVVTELGRLGSAAAVQPLLRLADAKGELGDAVQHALAEVRGRLANRPAGALALSEDTEGGLTLAADTGAPPERKGEP